MQKLTAALIALALILSFAGSRTAHAVLVEHRFAGLLIGEMVVVCNPFVACDPTSSVDAPFEIAITVDTEGVFKTGQIAGVGSAYVNDGAVGTWTVRGFGTASSNSVQIFTLPGIARVGFGWNGQFFPLNTSQPAERIFTFSAGEFALDARYGRLREVVPPIAVNLRTELKNPPGGLREFTTTIDFLEQGPLTLKALTNLSYSVVAAPEPSIGLLLILATVLLRLP